MQGRWLLLLLPHRAREGRDARHLHGGAAARGRRRVPAVAAETVAGEGPVGRGPRRHRRERGEPGEGPAPRQPEPAAPPERRPAGFRSLIRVGHRLFSFPPEGASRTPTQRMGAGPFRRLSGR